MKKAHFLGENKQIFLGFSFLIVFLFIGEELNAQLITDSDARLKTSVRKREGFVSNQRKRRLPGPSTKPTFERKSPPRYSAPISYQSGRVKTITPRTSPTPAWNSGISLFKSNNSKNRFTALSYSTSTRTRGVTPRYSQAQQRKVIALTSSPRYSPGSPFRTKDNRVQPRYSVPNRSGVLSLSDGPRYSPGSPFKAGNYRITPRYSTTVNKGALSLARLPRYSPGSPYRPKDYNVKPRYSAGSSFIQQNVTIKPRYSQQVNRPMWVYNVKPRYSPDPPFSREQHRVSPRYSIEHKYSIKQYWQLRSVPLRGTMASYTGPIKIKGDKKKQFHPSAGYLNVTHASSAQLKEAYRSWSILWNRMYGNNVQPPAVKEKASKPKFDKKEREIWNN